MIARGTITVYNGVKYASRSEATRAAQLDMLMKAQDENERVIDWARQVKYKLDVDGVHICNYFADFVITYGNGDVVAEDVKGLTTYHSRHGKQKTLSYEIFLIKKQLMKAIYDIDVREYKM